MSLSSFIATPILLPFIIGIFRFNYFDKSLRYLFYFVTYGTLNEVASFIIAKFDFSNTMPKSHLYTFVAFLLLGFFYIEVFKGFIDRKKIVILIVTFELYMILNAIFFQSIFEFPDFPRSISYIVFILASVICYYKVMVEASIKNLWSEPLVWINTAILIYYSGSLFSTVLFNYILEYSVEFAKQIVYFFGALTALFYVLIAVGFGKAGKQKR